jgi:hypothetical protein
MVTEPLHLTKGVIQTIAVGEKTGTEGWLRPAPAKK